MSWIRLSPESDVYVYERYFYVRGAGLMLVCCHGADHFADHADFHAKRYSEMAEHLRGHRDAGFRVPERVFDALASAASERGDIVRSEAELRRARAGRRK